MPEHFIASAFRGYLSVQDVVDLQKSLSGLSQGRFAEMLLSNVTDDENIYLNPVRLNSELDVKNALVPFYEGSIGVDLGVGLKTGLCTSVAEVLMNACMHADAHGSIVFVGDYCKHDNTLDVSVYDRGVGFRSRISKFLNKPAMTACEAIEWALEEGHSIDTYKRAAGIGLNETVDFMRRNGGLMEIISGDAIWALENCQASMRRLPSEIVGALVNFRVVVDSSVSYSKRVDAVVPKDGLEVEKR